jgi:hypothetical protein
LWSSGTAGSRLRRSGWVVCARPRVPSIGRLSLIAFRF